MDTSSPDSAPRSGGGAILLLCSTALFLSSLILFAIQPMFTKMILPLLGGTPAVWNTAMVFFQAVLLAGYLYAHLLSRLKRLRTQAFVHLVVLALGLGFLPVRVAMEWTPTASAHPVLWLIALLAVSIGAPFFAITATAPLLQRWFSHSGHPHASDPYFLYVASNIGGLAALVAYPTVIEPLFGLALQSRLWTSGYALLAILIVTYAISLWRARGNSGLAAPTDSNPQSEIGNPQLDDLQSPEALTAEPGLSSRLSWTSRARWVALSFVPSALLLAVTLHISTDVAAVPFLWVAPLLLYLLSFIVVFARRPILKHRWMLWVQPWVYALVALYFTEGELWHILTLHLLTLFVAALVYHGELVRRRPAVQHLTEFYLWMSVGGLLGGVFCALIAPVIFNSVLEYPLVLTLSCLLLPAAHGRLRRYWLDLALPTALALMYHYARQNVEPDGIIIERWQQWANHLASLHLNQRTIDITAPILVYFALALVLWTFRKRPLRFTLGFGVLILGSVLADRMDHQIFRQRSFFGVYVVTTSESGSMHKLYHGTTEHGDQYTDPNIMRTPTSYYTLDSPIAQVFEALRAVRALKQVAVFGLGTGTTACYQEPGQTMTFFEVDPVMERIARDPNLFRYLELCGQDVKVVIGDGRQSLARMPDGTYDLLILDAFSSDAIPVHLLTREALATYMRKLAPYGIVMFHISNRYVNLEPVIANIAADTGLSALIGEYEPDEESPVDAASSTWVIVARDDAGFESLTEDDRWRRTEPDARVGVWTDDYSNIFRTLIWGKLFDLP